MSPGGRVLRGVIRAYQLTLSSLVGRQCRHLPTCSDYAAEAIGRHGAWAGSWMAFARVCRCGPFGTHGLDYVCEELPPGAAPHRPWRYARWRGTNPVAARPAEERPEIDQLVLASTSMSRSSPLSTLKSRV